MSGELNNWHVYLIVSNITPRRTYIGATNNFDNRLATHNRGKGSRYTKIGYSVGVKQWEPVILVSGFTKSQALSFEMGWQILTCTKGVRKSNSNECKNIYCFNNSLNRDIIALVKLINDAIMVDGKFTRNKIKKNDENNIGSKHIYELENISIKIYQTYKLTNMNNTRLNVGEDLNAQFNKLMII